MDYFRDNWGDFVSLLGVAITIVGLWWAIRRVTQARTSAAAAEVASKETRDAITRVLTVVDLQRAIALIQRLKVLHRESKWEASLEHYQPLRVMLADIDARCSSFPLELRSVFFGLPFEPHTMLLGAIPQIVVMENNIDEALRAGTQPTGLGYFNEVLNTMQAHLERIASSTFPGSGGGK